MDFRIQIFYRQYLQQVDFAMLSFPPYDVLLEPQIQRQILQFFFDDVSEKISPLPKSRSGMYLPLHSYRKRVLKEITLRIENAVGDPDEDEISNDLMERMASLSLIPSAPSLLPETAQLKSVVTYVLPHKDNIITNDNDHVLIEECPNLLAAAGTTGHKTWEASLHLAMYLLATNNDHKAERSLVTNKSVLELGAGAGLLSIICAGPLSAAHVLATDGDEAIRERIGRNVLLNQHLCCQQLATDLGATTIGHQEMQRRIPLEAKILQWGDSLAPLHQKVLRSDSQNSNDCSELTNDLVQYDLILGADIIYSLESLEPLAMTISNLAGMYPKADILLSATIRNADTFDSFLTAFKQRHGLEVEEVDGFRCPPFEKQRALFHNCYPNPPIRIVKIKKQVLDNLVLSL